MIRWSLSAELLCIIILMLLMFSSHGQKQAPTRSQRVYQTCLLLSLDSILLNILCVFTIVGTIAVPLWLNVLLNSLYFFISVLMCSVMAAYLFSLILEHAYSDQTLRRAIVFVAVLTLFFAAAVLWNIPSGILFSLMNRAPTTAGLSTPWATASWRLSWRRWSSATFCTAKASAGTWPMSCTPCPLWWCS